jgi:hypothetical protein
MDRPINEYMDVAKAAQILGVTTKDVYKHITAKQLNAEQHVGKIVIHQNDLQLFIWSKHYRGKARREMK